jgi:hypothetical protein
MGHTIHVQVFNADDTETVDDLPGFLVSEVVTTELDTLVDTRHNLTMFPPLGRTFGKFAMLALDFRQGLLFLTEKAGIGNLFTGGEGGKGFESYVNSDLGRHCGQAFRFALARETHVPLAGRTASNGTGFHLAQDLTVIDHLDTANLGESHAVIRLPLPADNMRETKATLREGEAIVAVSPTKTGKARIFISFASSEKSFEGQVNTNGDILQDLGVDTFKGGAFLFQERIGRLLLITRETFSCVRVSMLALLQQMVIQPTTLIKGLVELVNLLPGGIDAILKHFTHVHILCLNCRVVKFSLPVGSGLFIPMSQARGLEARIGKS